MKSQEMAVTGPQVGKNDIRVGKARGGKIATFSMIAATAAVSASAQAAIAVPSELTDVFTDLAVAFGTLMAAGAVLFGVIRGGIALFKIASRVFSAAGA